MSVFILKRSGYMVVTMFAVSALIFLLLEISPGTVATKVLGAFSTEEQRRLWLEANGYFDPLLTRYFTWLGSCLSGDFGESIIFKVPVGDILWPRLINTAILGGAALAVIIPLSLGLGVLAGMREGSLCDRLISITSVVTTSIPEFSSAVFFSAVFVFWLNWLPGTSGMAEGFNLKELILPVLILIVYDFGYVTRMTRSSMAEVMMTPYIRAAILKGLPRNQVIINHALRNALIGPFTIIMLQINWLLSGVIVVEFFFAYKGFGALLLEASLNQDIYLIEACAMVAVVVSILTQTIADIMYTQLNPRISF